jgi:hypothetical protein
MFEKVSWIFVAQRANASRSRVEKRHETRSFALIARACAAIETRASNDGRHVDLRVQRASQMSSRAHRLLRNNLSALSCACLLMTFIL